MHPTESDLSPFSFSLLYRKRQLRNGKLLKPDRHSSAGWTTRCASVSRRCRGQLTATTCDLPLKLRSSNYESCKAGKTFLIRGGTRENATRPGPCTFCCNWRLTQCRRRTMCACWEYVGLTT